MAKTNRKESRKIYEGYKKRQRLWNTIFIVFFAVIGIGSAVLNGTMELDPQIVIGKYEFTWFHLVILAVLVVLLGFGIVALKRDSSEEQQEIYRQERLLEPARRWLGLPLPKKALSTAGEGGTVHSGTRRLP